MLANAEALKRTAGQGTKGVMSKHDTGVSHCAQQWRPGATVRCARTFLLIVTNNSRVWAGRPPWTVEGVKARWFNAVSLAAAGRLPHPIYPLPSASLQSAHGILSLFTRFWWSSAGACACAARQL